jgi:hypothetical protein
MVGTALSRLCAPYGLWVKPGDDTHHTYFFFFPAFGFGSGFSACGSKPI